MTTFATSATRSEVNAWLTEAAQRRQLEHPPQDDLQCGVRVEVEHAGVTVVGCDGIQKFAARLRFPASFRGPVQPAAVGVILVVADPVHLKKKVKCSAVRLVQTPLQIIAGFLFVWHAVKAASVGRRAQSKSRQAAT